MMRLPPFSTNILTAIVCVLLSDAMPSSYAAAADGISPFKASDANWPADRKAKSFSSAFFGNAGTVPTSRPMGAVSAAVILTVPNGNNAALPSLLRESTVDYAGHSSGAW